MTAVDRIAAGIWGARLDGEGRLISADPALLALNARAGGAIGQALALPALATVVRLARRLGVVVSRAVTVADDEHDIQMWARAQPDGDAIRLATSGWREVLGWRPARARDAVDEMRLADAAWRWETDAALRLTLITPEAGPAHG
ncbi:MAG TPA: PAS domain-containing sensor histidine kinase, partial [Sphingomonas sp.]